MAGKKRESAITDEQRAAADLGASSGREAVGDIHAALTAARERCAGDPAALARMATVVLHGLVGTGLSGADADSAAAGARADRAKAVRALGLSPTDLAELLGLGQSRAQQISADAHKR